MHDKVVIQCEDGAKEIGGIALPPTILQKVPKGLVVAVGRGEKKGDKMKLKQGDYVLHNIYAGRSTDILIENKRCITMQEKEVIVVFDKKEKHGFRLLRSDILILPDELEKFYGRGIEKPHEQVQIQRKGTIVKVGDMSQEPTPMYEGQKVHYYANAGSGMIEGRMLNLDPHQKYIVMNPMNILGVYE